MEARTNFSGPRTNFNGAIAIPSFMAYVTLKFYRRFWKKLHYIRNNKVGGLILCQ